MPTQNKHKDTAKVPQRHTDACVLVVEPDADVRKQLQLLLSVHFELVALDNDKAACTWLEKHETQVVLCAAKLLGSSAELQRSLEQRSHESALLCLVDKDSSARATGTADSIDYTALQTEHGRVGLLLSIERLVVAFRDRELAAFSRSHRRRAAVQGHNLLIGISAAVARLRHEIARSAVDMNVLITGETGVGKTLVAEALHDAYAGASRAFVAIEPATLPPSLFESELFGYARGAFTGAVGARMGAFEAANDGTVFLDEIGDVPLALQVKLLRVVETKTVRRLGGQSEKKLNVRVLAATSRDLEADVAEGRFREDLFQRLNEIRLHIPPLRERREDVIPLLEHFMGAFAEDRRTACTFSPDAMRLLLDHAWPGNVRELRTLARRLCQNGMPQELTLETLVPLFPARIERGADQGLRPEERIAAFSRRVYSEELARHGYRLRETARALNLPYPTLRSRVASLGLLELCKGRGNSR